MGTVIDLKEKIKQRDELKILIRDKVIEINGYRGKIEIYLNSTNVYSKNNVWAIKKVVNLFKTKKVYIISEEKFKENFMEELKEISYDRKYKKEHEYIFDKIKSKLKETSDFQLYRIIGNTLDIKSCITVTGWQITALK